MPLLEFLKMPIQPIHVRHILPDVFANHHVGYRRCSKPAEGSWRIPK